MCEWKYGFPQGSAHFVDCVLNDKQPLVTGEDARIVMGIVFAAYESAGTGRRVEWPYEAPKERTPVEVWRQSPQGITAQPTAGRAEAKTGAADRHGRVGEPGGL